MFPFRYQTEAPGGVTCRPQLCSRPHEQVKELLRSVAPSRSSWHVTAGTDGGCFRCRTVFYCHASIQCAWPTFPWLGHCPFQVPKTALTFIGSGCRRKTTTFDKTCFWSVQPTCQDLDRGPPGTWLSCLGLDLVNRNVLYMNVRN